MRSRSADNRELTGPKPVARGWSRTGLDRVSCGWRDAVGPGFATGVTEKVTLTVSALDSGRYCH